MSTLPFTLRKFHMNFFGATFWQKICYYFLMNFSPGHKFICVLFKPVEVKMITVNKIFTVISLPFEM